MYPILVFIGLLVALVSAGCDSDNCLRALRGREIGTSFCSEYLAVTLTVHPPLPSYLKACSTTRVSSGCSCLLGVTTQIHTPTTTVTSSSVKTASSVKSFSSIKSSGTSTSSKLSSTSKSSSGSLATSSKTSSSKTSSSKTSSSKISSSGTKTSSTTKSFTTSSSTSIQSTSSSKVSSATSQTSSSTSSTVSTPSCTPSFSLIGASDTAFNAQLTAFNLRLSCTSLDVNNYTVLVTGGPNIITANGNPVSGTTNTSSSITIPGFAPGPVNLVVVAMDTSGNAILQSFQLLFGNIDMPVIVLDENNAPVSGVTVFANATTYPGVGQVGTTDINGLVTFTNLVSTTIGLTARTSDNSIAVNGVAASLNTVTLNLLPFAPASNTTDFAISNGTTGWTGGFNEVLAVTKRDTVLAVSTNGQYNIQYANSQPKVYPFTNTVYIKYQFQTDEIPGGYFGTIYNDYYIITIRTDTGGYASVSHSMNELGLGAFDSNGFTDWYTLQLPTSLATQWINYDIGVSNVVDNLFDSQIIVDKIGDLTCQTCGDCSTCPGDPMCQATCLAPPMMSCDFYASCAEKTLQCGPGGYPLNYGQKNCLKFQNNLAIFSPAGQAFIWSTMHCLQLALVSAIQCDSTCDSVQAAAFASHPTCYIQGGFCSLPPMDIWHVVTTVWGDLFSAAAVKQILQTGGGCLAQMLTNIETEIQTLLSNAVSDVVNAAAYLAQAAALQILKASLQNAANAMPGGL